MGAARSVSSSRVMKRRTYWNGQTGCPSRLPEEHVHHPRLADSHRMVYRQRANRYIGGIGPPDGERRPACSSTTSPSGQTARSSARSLPWSPFVCPRGPILTRIGPCGQGRKPRLNCGDALETPIGIEPTTYSLRGSYRCEKRSAGRPLPRQSRQLSWVSLTGSRSCMTKMRPRERCSSSRRMPFKGE